MAQNISLLGASYSDVPAVMLPKTGGGTAKFDDTTDANATASDISIGKTAYVNGIKLVGTNEGGGGGGDEPEPWVRPSDWPDLSLMDISGGNIIYMTSYADEARGFCSFSISAGSGRTYTVEVGNIEGSSFVTESTYTYNSASRCDLYYGSTNGTYKVLRITTNSNITRFVMQGSTIIQIDGFNGYSSNQGIIDIVGDLPFCTYFTFTSIYNVINISLNKIKPTLLSSAFSNCHSLTSVGTSGWDTSAVTAMSNMFSGCESLKSVDVSGWDTSAVTNMGSTFSNCTSLKSVDVSGWDTSAVTAMNSMFYNCTSLTSLDVSEWDTSAVTNMTQMFGNCYSLKSLDVSGWDTSAVTNMGSMFTGCRSLKSLDVSGWDTSAVTSMNSMFSYCASLTSVDVSGWDTSAVTSMNSMFNSCFSLTSVDTSGWDTSAVTTMNSMFNGCYSLTSLDVSEWDTSAVTNIAQMFYNCYSLKSVDVSGWDTSAVTTMAQMFYNCNSLKSLDVSEWDFSKINSNNNWISFSGCYGLYKSITLSSSFAYILSSCFSYCRSLYEWHFLSTTPPTLATISGFPNMTDFGGKKIYVPYSADHSVLNAYKTATNWSTYAQYIVEEPQGE